MHLVILSKRQPVPEDSYTCSSPEPKAVLLAAHTQHPLNLPTASSFSVNILPGARVRKSLSSPAGLVEGRGLLGFVGCACTTSTAGNMRCAPRRRGLELRVGLPLLKAGLWKRRGTAPGDGGDISEATWVLGTAAVGLWGGTSSYCTGVCIGPPAGRWSFSEPSMPPRGIRGCALDLLFWTAYLPVWHRREKKVSL